MIVNQMFNAVSPIMNKIHALDFNTELAQGNLAKEKFIFYLNQDALYLADYARALALTAAKLNHAHQTQQFIQFSMDAIKAEKELHANYLKQYLPTASVAEQSPACFMYTNYLLKMANMATVEEAVASLLPCFWIYKEVGVQMLKNGNKHNNPYQAWIDLYSCEQFAKSVQAIINITNELGEHANDRLQTKMIQAFLRASQLEWLFWDCAYKCEQWVV